MVKPALSRVRAQDDFGWIHDGMSTYRKAAEVLGRHNIRRSKA